MVYGILLESIVQCFILEKHDKILLEQVEEYVQFSLSHLNLFDLYDDNLMIRIAEGMRMSFFSLMLKEFSSNSHGKSSLSEIYINRKGNIFREVVHTSIITRLYKW